MRMRSIPQSVSNRLAPYRASFKSAPAQHFNIWCWLLVTLIVASSGQVKTLTRYMPSRLAYWTTLRMVRAKVWNEQALLDLMVADILYCLPPPKDGVLHLIFDTTRKEKTGEKQPLAFTTKMGKFEPYVFGHSVLMLIAQWGRRRDYWTYRSEEKLSTLGDVTLVLSKRRFNDPPHKIKLLVTNLKDASTC